MSAAGGLLLAWWVTAWVHALMLLSLVWLLERSGLLRAPGWRETAWRAALFTPLLSASLQLLLALQPLAGRWSLAESVAQFAMAGERSISASTSEQAAPALSRAAATQVAATETPPSVAVETTPAAPAAIRRGEPALAVAPNVLGALGLLWTLAAAALAARRVQQWRRERQRIRALPALRDNDMQALLAGLARGAGAACPILHRDAAASSPLAWSPDRICLPPALIGALSREQWQAVLAHELAHLRRRDPQWRLAGAVLAAALPVPLSGVARRRLTDLAEHACDAWAAEQTGQGRALAEALARCAETRLAQQPPSMFAAPMAQSRSALVERVQRLIEEKPMSFAIPTPLRRLALLSALLIASLALPGFAFGDGPQAAQAVENAEPPEPPEPPAPPAPPAAPSPSASVAELAPPAPPAPAAPPAPPADTRDARVKVNHMQWLFGESTTVEVRLPDRRFRFEADGDFEINAEETDLAELDDKASVEETFAGETRRIAFERDGGSIQRRYFVDGREQPMDATARAWLADAMRRVLREAAIEVEVRAARIFQRGGATALLEEIAAIDGEYARGRYLGELFGQPGIDDAALQRAVALTASIRSDYTRRVVLQRALKQQNIGVAAQRAILAVAADFESDYERRVLLQTAAARISIDATVLQAWIDALSRSASAYESRVALQSLFKRDGLPTTAQAGALTAIAGIDSDYERRVALQAAVKHVAATPGLTASYAGVVAGMESGYEARVALQALLGSVALDHDSGVALIDAAAGIDGDYERRLALVAIVDRMPADADLIARCSAAARGLGNDDRGRVERALDRLRG